MKTPLRFVLSLISLSLGVTAAAGPAESVRVQSSRNLRVVIVDASKPGEARSAVHETFAMSLATSLQRPGASLPVKITEESDAAKAAADLNSGAYDAALIFENNLPSTVRSADFAVARGVSDVGVPVRVFHLVLKNNDATMVSTLTSAFGETVKSPRFQEALSRSVAVRVVASNSL
ncbi:MAG: hypothetical protein ABIZ81_04625 [Opitutaceae bacterium]